MALDYASYEEAMADFTWDERWELFDAPPETFNITHECLDRWNDEMTAARIVYNDGRTSTHTVGELRSEAAQLAHYLTDRGVDHGDDVAIMLEPSPELFSSMFALWNLGAIFVPMSTLFGPDEVSYFLEDSDPELVITSEEFEDLFPASVEKFFISEFDTIDGYSTSFTQDTEAEDIAVRQYTSGTTGRPESVNYKHKTLTYSVLNVKFSKGLRPEDRYFCTSKPFWGQGIWLGVLSPLALENALGAYSGKFDPSVVLEGLELFEITNIAASATALKQMSKANDVDAFDISLERITSSGEYLDPGSQQLIEEKLGAPVGNTYGVTEFGTITADFQAFDDWEIKPGSIGKPFLGLEVAVIDDDGNPLPPGEVGEIAVKKEGDWERTGDSAITDADGYLYHKGRHDDVIISAGYRIDPYEVEDTLRKHDAVDEVAVIGIPDSERTNIVKAFVKPRDGYEKTDVLEQSIKDFVKDTLNKYKYPREIEFLDAFPRTAAGSKIKRSALKEDVDRPAP